MALRIAVDAMGGDNAPAAVVEGAAAAAAKNPGIQVILVGKEEVINEELNRIGSHPENIQIVNATEVIENEDAPVKAVRSKKDSSMVKAVTMVKNGEADAALSAGNTGALMTSALLILGRIKGLERPAIVTAVPHLKLSGGFSLLVDCGANSECSSKNLMGFAHMGSIYMRDAFGVENPTVGLVNIGTEEKKGTAVLKETYQMLKESPLNFIGNVEAREIPHGASDVLVCDGFTGNVILKLMEGEASAILALIKEKLSESVSAKLGGALVYGKLKELKAMFDYSSYGASPILGVKGLVCKMHGSSKANAVENAVVKAAAVAESNIVAQLTTAMEAVNASESEPAAE